MSLKNERAHERAHAAGAATRRVPRRAVASLKEYTAEEREIISWYNDILCSNGEGWWPVDRFTPEVRKAIADYLADYDYREPYMRGRFSSPLPVAPRTTRTTRTTATHPAKAHAR